MSVHRKLQLARLTGNQEEITKLEKKEKIIDEKLQKLREKHGDDTVDNALKKAAKKASQSFMKEMQAKAQKNSTPPNGNGGTSQDAYKRKMMEQYMQGQLQNNPKPTDETSSDQTDESP